MKILVLFLITFLLLHSCVKNVGKLPNAYSDKAMLDSINSPTANNYYLGNSTTLLSGAHGPHGSFLFRFNNIAYAALTDGGKLPVGSSMPEGSLVIKDIKQAGGQTSLFAFMYKKSGSWIWGEIEPNGTVQYSVSKNPSTCTSCHNQTGNRDLIVSFVFY